MFLRVLGDQRTRVAMQRKKIAELLCFGERSTILQRGDTGVRVYIVWFRGPGRF